MSDTCLTIALAIRAPGIIIAAYGVITVEFVAMGIGLALIFMSDATLIAGYWYDQHRRIEKTD